MKKKHGIISKLFGFTFEDIQFIVSLLLWTVFFGCASYLAVECLLIILKSFF